MEKRRDLWLIGAAAAMFGVAVVRAARESITIDEASTFLNHVWRVAPAEWDAVNNNHLLNTLLMRLFTSLST